MIENENERFEAALAFAKKKHSGQVRKGGGAAIIHPIAVEKTVRKKGGNIDCRIAALFHDLLEDTDASDSEIEAIGGARVLELVKLLTKKPGYIMSEYVGGILSDPDAKLIKAADRLHNLRSSLLADERFRLKYIKETEEWYMDFMPEIPPVVEALKRSLMGSTDICVIIDALIRYASYDAPVTAEKLCGYCGYTDPDTVSLALEFYTDRQLPLGAAIHKKDGGYYADLLFSDTDTVILRTALMGMPYCEPLQAAEMSRRLNDLLPEHLRESYDELRTGTQLYSGTFHANITELINALYPAPEADGSVIYRKVRFRNCSYDEHGLLIPKLSRDGTGEQIYCENPLKLICKNDFFYLITYSRGYNGSIFYRSYRVDRIKDVECTDEPADDYEKLLPEERRELLRLKRVIDRDRAAAHKEGRIYLEPKEDPARLDAASHLDSRGFDVNEFMHHNSVMFVDTVYSSAVIKVVRSFLNTITDSFGYGFDVVREDDDEFITIRVHSVAESALKHIALEFVDKVEVLSARKDEDNDDDDKAIRAIISNDIRLLAEKYCEDHEDE